MTLKYKIGESGNLKEAAAPLKKTQRHPQKVNINLQDHFLNTLRKEGRKVSITLLNGEKLEGKINGFDTFSIILEGEDESLIYKHGISTISIKNSPPRKSE